MKKTLIFSLCLFSVVFSFGQKVDIDNQRIYVDYASLPHHRVDDNLTYSLQVIGTYKFDKQEVADALNLRGWEYVEEGGNVLVKVKMSDFVRGKSSSSKRVAVKKDKDGKVTSRTTYYKYTSTNTGRASMSIYGPKNLYTPPNKKGKGKKKKKKKSLKEKLTNPFLKDVDLDTNDDSDDTERVAYYDLTINYTVDGGESTSIKKARDQYNSKSNQEYSEQKDTYVNSVIGRANNGLNQTYGYNRLRDWAKFKKLDSKKHPEYEMYKNATEAMAAIMAGKRFNKSHADITTNMEPLLDYFQSIVDKYGNDDKHHKRLKAASMYNMAQIYYYLDQPDKVIEIGNAYIAWDYDEKDGNRFADKGEKLKHLLAFHEVEGRFFETNEDADAITSEDITEEEN